MVQRSHGSDPSVWPTSSCCLSPPPMRSHLSFTLSSLLWKGAIFPFYRWEHRGPEKFTGPRCGLRRKSKPSDSKSMFFPVCLFWAFIFLDEKLRNTSFSLRWFPESEIHISVEPGASLRKMVIGSPGTGCPLTLSCRTGGGAPLSAAPPPPGRATSRSV